MGCQSAPGRVRLTDQALVAVAVARQAGGHHGRHPTAADVLTGLAAEPDGHAGCLLREVPSAAVALVERAVTAPTRLPALEAVVGRAAGRQRARPVSTADLLAALREAGGADVADLLAACGYDVRALYRAATGLAASEAETFGLGSDPGLSVDAAVAVARARAAGGGALDLLVAIAATAGGEGLLAADADELATALARLRAGAAPETAGADWDRGLDAVLGAARAMVEPPIGPLDLVRAALVAGGHGVVRLLETTEATDRRGPAPPQAREHTP